MALTLTYDLGQKKWKCFPIPHLLLDIPPAIWFICTNWIGLNGTAEEGRTNCRRIRFGQTDWVLITERESCVKD